MFKYLLAFLLALICVPTLVSAQDSYLKGVVSAINSTTTTKLGDSDTFVQELQITLPNQTIQLTHGQTYAIDKSQLLKVGDQVVLVESQTDTNTPYYQIIDRYRLTNLWPILTTFFVLVILLSRKQGLGSIIGMLLSLAIIAKFMVPAILAGQNALLVSILSCLAIMVSTIYLAHGFNPKTTLALISTAITLVVTGLLSTLFVFLTHLSGLSSEDAMFLNFGLTSTINFQGLLLGGILIGALGVLDDVTTSLASSIFELAKANPKYTFTQLFASGLAIGREHIASLVNTLVLAYAGASLPLFIILVLNPTNSPLWFLLNSEFIVEEVVRTLSGSIGLILAVPTTALLTSWYLSRAKKLDSSDQTS
jgi:uncharacterized membrane protein